MSRAHGHEITSSTRARYIHCEKGPRPNRGGSTATSNAMPVTAGVYQRAMRVMNRSVGALRATAFSTISKMRAMEESAKAVVTCTRRAALRLMVPASTLLPGAMRWGTDSPVRGDVSTCDSPSSTAPSSGIFSPGRTSMWLPGPSTSGSTSRVVPSASISWAILGRAASRALMERRERPAARSCTNSPTQ